ncbi:unnamed protein product [Rhizophagus irregularis]|nr:unnamed protein product [Rhizophagus irregularis]
MRSPCLSHDSRSSHEIYTSSRPQEEFENIHLLEFAHDDCNEAILSNKDEHVLLYSRKKFQLCEDCKAFIDESIYKALRSNSNSEQLIKLLQEFSEVGKSDSEELNEINQEDEINDNSY